MSHVAVVLSGCGVFDGSEIHEAVLVLLALQEAGAQISIVAPNIEQSEVVNHLTGEKSEESRNVLVESARIARAKICALDEFDIQQIDAVIFPGGFGAAKNLSDFAQQGANCQVHPQISQLIQQVTDAHIPLGLVCIAPVLAARVLGNVTLTVGEADDPAVQALTQWDTQHQACSTEQIVCDESAKIVSTPAYMNSENLPAIRQGIKALVDQVLAWSSNETIRGILQQLPAWQLKEAHLYRTWEMKNFMHALAWVEKIAEVAEAHGHHPDLELGWGYVRMTLFTHDANAITDKDLQLALAIEALEMP